MIFVISVRIPRLRRPLSKGVNGRFVKKLLSFMCFPPNASVAEVRARRLSKARQASPRTSAGRGVPKTPQPGFAGAEGFGQGLVQLNLSIARPFCLLGKMGNRLSGSPTRGI